MRYTILVSVFVITLGVSFGQEITVGQVIDLQSREPIPFAHIISATLGTTSNLEGKFRMPVNVGDTLLITHVNFEPFRAIVTSDSMNIFLKPSDVLLNEVIIGLLPSEAQFKQEILESRVEPTKEEKAATETMQMAKTLFLAGYTPEMNSLDNYKDYIKGPQGVSILSSDPSKGIIKSFKNLNRYQSLFHTNYNYTESDSLSYIFRLNE
ncbi:MAG: hypothetical protein RIC35_08915 [Marinoscillum sp.]